MGEVTPQVVRLGKIGQHPNADNLSITHVLGNYSVVFRTGEFREGELAGYIPVDWCVPRSLHFEWLFSNSGKDRVRIKARKVRGILSMGLLVPLPSNDEWQPEPGQSVIYYFNLKKYEPEPRVFLDFGSPRAAPKTPVPVPTYDVEGLRRYADLIEEDTPVIITEKIHGTSGRFVYWGGKLHVGSRRNWVDPEGNSAWAEIARRYDLATKLRSWDGCVLYGEVYGKTQKLRYGLKGIELAIFDLFKLDNDKWLPPQGVQLFCMEENLPYVPVLYRGPFSLDLAYELAEGPSTVPGADHVREGIVIQPQTPAWDYTIGRVILKLAGEGFLSNKRS